MSGAKEEAALQNTTARLYIHTIQKGFQTGALIGMPLAALKAYRQGWFRHEVTRAALGTMGRTAAVFAVGTGLATAALIAFKPIDQDGIDDRAYRIYWNASQNRTDTFAQVGAAAGAAAAAGALGVSPRLMLGGAAAGAAFGVLAHVASNQSEVVTADNVPVGKDALPK